MQRKLTKFELEQRVRNMIRKMINKPSKSQKSVMADALRDNIKGKAA